MSERLREDGSERVMRLAGTQRRTGRGAVRALLPVRERWRVWVPFLVLATGLAVTAGASAMVRSQVVQDDRVRFGQATDLLVGAIQRGFDQYEDALRSTAGLVRVTDRLTADKFARFGASLDLEGRPGMRALGFATRVSNPGRRSFERRLQRENGLPGLHIWPPSQAATHVPVTFATPASMPNRRVLGYDLASSPPRRRALQRACATGLPMITRPVALVGSQTPEQRMGFAVFMPVYEHDANHNCENVRGYVVAAIERGSFFESIDDVLPAGLLQYSVDDVASNDAAVMYRTAPVPSSNARLPLQLEQTVGLGGREWRVHTWPGPKFQQLSQRRLVPSVLVAGVLISLALFWLVWSESRARAKAERVARDLYRSEAALARANQSKDEFLAMLGHELRNPLSAVKMALDILRTSDIDDPDARVALDVADRQMRHQTRLVDDLLDVSRVSRGKIVLKLERLDLRDVATDAVVGIESSEAAASHVFTIDRPAEAVWVDADPTRLEQVVTNLLSNAVKYSPDGGSVRVTVERDRAEGVVRVHDQGMGLDPAALSRIFDLFAQEDASIDRSAGGLGIGLTLVKRLVEMHEGRVQARSDGLGKGSEFEVRLPIASGMPRPRSAPPEPAKQQRLRILVIEDNEDARLMLRSLLEKQGHGVETASDGETGLEAALSNPPDAALIDIGLPNLDGFEVARRLRRAWKDARVLLIAVSGYGRPSDHERSMEAGFNHHVVKPVDPALLAKLLARARPRPHRARA